MSATFTEEPTTVPIANGRSVQIDPKQPWPSAYRGSRYSLVKSDDYGGARDVTLKWKHRDLKIFARPPDGVRTAMALAGKENAKGSFRVTANGEVITKIQAENYKHLDQAPVSDGWVPVYLGKLEGEIEIEDVPLNPKPPMSGVEVWRGLPFKHGERWSATTDGRLVWRWKDYEFESITDHSELVEEYAKYRSNGGRLYVTEHGHIWGNASLTDGPSGKRSVLRNAVKSWKETAERENDVATLRLVNRRMTATGGGDPGQGLVPIHIGHVRDFDDGVIPTPVVDDEIYYKVVGQYEQVWE